MNIKNETEKYLKKILKKSKTTITQGTIVAFLIGGFFGISSVTMAEWGFAASSKGIKFGGFGSIAVIDGMTTIGNNSALSTGTNSIAIGDLSKAGSGNTIALGYKAEAVSGNPKNVNAAVSAIAIGDSSKALSAQAIAIGAQAKAKEIDTIALGNGAEATVGRAIALGKETVAQAADTIAIGPKAQVTGINAIAIGLESKASNGTAIALGNKAQATGVTSTAIGLNAQATGDGSTAQGYNAQAEGKNAIALGSYVKAIGEHSIAQGYDTHATGERSIALGSGAKAADRGIAAGYSAEAKGRNSIALGEDSDTTGERTIGIGFNAKTEADRAIAIGAESGAKESNSIAIGPKAKAEAENAISLGSYVQATGERSIAQGYNTQATEEDAIAQGYSAKAIGRYALALGRAAEAKQYGTIAQGYGAKADGSSAIAIGELANINNANNAIGIGAGVSIVGDNNGVSGAVAIGKKARVDKVFGVAIGENTKANSVSVAIGGGAVAANYPLKDNPRYSSTYTEGATAVGYNAWATGVNSTALGRSSKANGVESLALGMLAKADGNNSVAIGSNQTDSFGPSATGNYSLAIMSQANAAGEKSIAIGRGALVQTIDTVYPAEDAIAIGTEAKALRKEAIAYGFKAKAEGLTSIALGSESEVIGVSSIGLGRKAIASGDTSVAIGGSAEAKGLSSVGVGVTSAAVGVASTALGFHSQANKEYSVALGGNSTANHSNSVALGSFSKTTDKNITSSGYLLDGDTTITSVPNKGVVSIGEDGKYTRRIVNLAGGVNDTDAVNVKQLKEMKIIYKANGANDQTVKLSDGLDFKDGTNTTATVGENGEVKYSVNKNLTGIESIDNGEAGAKITLGSEDKNVTFNGGKLKGIAAGEDETDAVNFGQVKDFINNTIQLDGDSGNSTPVALNNKDGIKFDIVGATGGDITTKASDNKIEIKLEKAITVTEGETKVVTSDAVYSAIVGAKPDIKTAESEKYITIEKTQGEGIEKDKFVFNTTKLDTVINGLAKNDLSNITDDGKGVITGLIDVQGTGAASVTSTEDDKSKVKTFTVNVPKTAKIDINSPSTEKLTTEKAVVDYVTNNAAGVVDLTYKSNSNEDTKKTVKLSDGLDFKDGTNTTATVGENGEVKYSVNKNLTGITSIDNGTNGAKITLGSGDENVTFNGGQLKGIAAGEDDTDAVNFGQVKDFINNTIQLDGDSGESTPVALNNKDGIKFNIKGAANSGIITNANGTTIEIALDNSKISENLNLSYKANSGTAQSVSLASGLDFLNGDNTTASVDIDGKVKYSLNSTLTGIEGVYSSLSTDPTNKTNSFGLTKDGLNFMKNGYIDTTTGVFNFDKSATIDSEGMKILDPKNLLASEYGVNKTSHIDGKNNVSSILTSSGLTVKSDAESNKSESILTKESLSFKKNDGSNSILIDGNSGRISNLEDGVALTDAVNVRQLNALGNNTIQLGGDSGTITPVALNNKNGIKFDIVGETGGDITTVASTDPTNKVIIKLAKSTEVASGDTKPITSDAVYNYITNNAAGVLDLTYKSNSNTTTEKKVRLSKGLDFLNGDNTTASVDIDGKVKYSLNSTLTGIEGVYSSLSADPTNKTNSFGLTKDGLNFMKNGYIDTTTGAFNFDKSATINSDGMKILDPKNLLASEYGVNKTSHIDGKNKVSSILTSSGLTMKSDDPSNKSESMLTKESLSFKKNDGSNSILIDGNSGRISNLEDGVALTDAVNVRQLNALGNNTIQLGGDSGTTTPVALNNKNGIKFDIVGETGGDITTAASTDPTNPTNPTNKVVIKLAKSTEVASGDTKPVTSDAVYNYITNNATGVLDLTYKSNSDTTTEKKVKLSKGLDFINGDNTTASVDKLGKVKYSLNSTLTGIESISGKGTTLKLVMDGLDLGGKKITNLGKGSISNISTDAINGSQLFAVKNDITTINNSINDIKTFIDKGFNLKTADGNTANVRLGDTIDIKNGLNIDVTGNPRTGGSGSGSGTGSGGGSGSGSEGSGAGAATHDVTIATVENPTFKDVKADKVELQDAAGNKTVINPTGTTVTNNAGDTTIVKADKVIVKDNAGKEAVYDKNGVSAKDTTTNKEVTLSTDKGLVINSGSPTKTVTINEGNVTSSSVTTKVVDGLDDINVNDDGKVDSSDGKKAVNGNTLNKTVDTLRGENLALREQIQNSNNAINHVNERVTKLETRVNKGLANAAAMSGIEFLEIGKNQASVAAAVGGYRGQHAVAVGVQAAPTENVRLNAKVSLTPGSHTSSMYSVGAAWRFNLK